MSEESGTKKSKKEKAAEAQKINDITERLEFIEADEAEGKAMEILSGVGFKEEDFKL